MTFDPERRGGGRVPTLRDHWREPLRAQRDPLDGGAGRIRSDRDVHRQWRKQSWLGRFVTTYGWRAYALPVLVVITAVVVYQAVSGTGVPDTGGEAPIASPPTIGSAGTVIIGAPPRGLTEFDVNLPTGVLPTGDPYTETGAKTFHVVPGQSPQFGEGTAKVFAYTVEVEDGLDPVNYGGDETFAGTVDGILHNARGWTHNPKIGFLRVDATSGVEPDFRISLTSPMTVQEGCGYEIPLEASCYNPAFGPGEARVFINEARWVRGAVPFQGDDLAYRQYLINHEVGHALGYQHHEPCPEQGALAPIMMQQTFGTSNDEAARFDPEWVKADGKTCRPNPWPAPIP